MNYIIFDLEWNQPADDRSMICEPVFLSGEIIEIGAVKLDEQFRMTDGLKLYIKPQHYRKLHRKIASLTGISDKTLAAQGLTFPEAFEKFRQWCGEEYTYMTWSMTDLLTLTENMLLHGLDVSDLPPVCDLQRIFGREIMREQRRHSLEEALEVLGEKGEAAHDALHDSKNTALVCKHLDLEDYIGEYVSKVFGEAPGARLYESREELLNDAALSEFTCPYCGAAASCSQWIRAGFRGDAALGTCDEGDEFWVQLYAQKNFNGQYQARRLFFDLSDDLWEIYQDYTQPQPV